MDEPNESGLLLGLRRFDTRENPTGEKKRSWHVFRAAETPAFESAARFALPLAGYDTWEQAKPRPGPFPEYAPEWANLKKRDAALIDLIAEVGEADIESVLDTGIRLINLPDGGMVEALYLHPLGADKPHAAATYRLSLPAGSRPQLVFQTYLSKEKSSGVIFRVRVDGKERFEAAVTDQAMTERRVDLSADAGREVELTLEVDPGKNNSHDQAHFISPAIVEAPRDP